MWFDYREAFGGQLAYAMDVLRSWGLENVKRDDATILQYVCAVVSYRSVLLASLRKYSNNISCSLMINSLL